MLLKGIKVLDLSSLLPGPLCSMMLADLGAEVIKIESPKGDMMRTFENSFFKALNRNKKSIVIDLKTSEGKQIFKRLAKNADVIIEGFRPGKLGSLGLGYNEIRKINPKIIYCSITGYGQKGKNKDKAGHDLNYSALSGMLHVISEKPIVPGVQIADVSSAFIAAFSIASSLLQRERTDKGNYIDVSMFRSSLFAIGMHISKYSSAGEFNKILKGDIGCYNVYEAKDGKYLSLGAIEHKFWKSFCECIGRNDLLDRQFDSSLLPELRRIFKGKTLSEWNSLNRKFDFCCEPVKSVPEIIEECKDHIVAVGQAQQIRFPAIFSSFEAKYRKYPKLGEDTFQILKMLGYSKGEISRLKSKKAIYDGKP